MSYFESEVNAGVLLHAGGLFSRFGTQSDGDNRAFGRFYGVPDSILVVIMEPCKAGTTRFVPCAQF